MQMTIYIAFPLTETERNIIRENTQPSDVLIWSKDLPAEKRFDAYLNAEIVFGNIPPKWLEKNKHLRWIQLYSAGFNEYLDLDWEATLSDIQVTNLKNFFGIPVAETAVAGILALYRKIDELAILQAQKKWIGSLLRPQMNVLHHKKVLILGAGAIGATAKKILEGFSCNITTISRSSTPGLSDLDNLLPDAEIIINCLPETNETINIFTKKRIELMQANAMFVNVGRGSVVEDESALLEALQQSKISAVLDVSHEEPLPPNHPLWTCPNVFITQHTGGGYMHENLDKTNVFIDNLNRYRSGTPLQNIVNFKRGY
jgi:phosphoglycerate dehydrogenase-like enzyme